MSNLSDYAETLLANFIANAQTATRPTTWYLALYTSAPGDANASGTEVSGSGYARQAITFGAASSGVTANTSTHTFTASGGNWGTINGWAVYDSLTTGNELFWGVPATNRTINDGDSLTVAASAITLTMA